MSSSQSSKVEVLWSPNKDEDFATYSNELKLYSFKVYMYVLEGEKSSIICTKLLDMITWIEEVCIVFAYVVKYIVFAELERVCIAQVIKRGVHYS